MGVRVGAVPHDLLKIVSWRGHVSPELIERVFPRGVRGRYKVVCWDFQKKDEFRTLEQIIEHHHSIGGFWERLWAFSDSLSTVAGRFRLECDYWYSGRADPFFVRAYGDIKEWRSEERERLWNSIVEILARFCDKEAEHVEAFAEINELLKDFPADTRFPFVSLKTHHWLTDAIRKNHNFWLKCVKEGKEVSFKKIYMVSISIAEPEFTHRLKELRSFRASLSEGMRRAVNKLSGWFPLQISDDLYMVCLEESEVKEILRVLAGTEFGYEVDVFEWLISREERKTLADGSKETIYIIEASEPTLLTAGVHEEFEYVPESYAEWAKILDGEYDYVAWVCIMPKGDMDKIAKEFLEKSEEELKKRERVPLPEPVHEPNPFLSPELALSIADGYNEFLEDCAMAVNEENPEANTVCRSFGRALFISGLREPSEAYELYDKIASLKAKLHISAVLSVVTAKPKYPFWRILELFRFGADCLVFVVGEKMVRLADKDVNLIRQVVPSVRNVSRSQFSEIITLSRRTGLEELKFHIEGKAADGKIPVESSRKICWLVDQLTLRFKSEELKAVIYRSLKMLEPFTRRERWR